MIGPWPVAWGVGGRPLGNRVVLLPACCVAAVWCKRGQVGGRG